MYKRYITFGISGVFFEEWFPDGSSQRVQFIEVIKWRLQGKVEWI